MEGFNINKMQIILRFNIYSANSFFPLLFARETLITHVAYITVS